MINNFQYFLKNLSPKILLLYSLFDFLFILAESHLSPIEIPAYNNERCNVAINNRTNKEKHEFIPVPTIVGFIFIGVWFGFILIAKIMYNSSDQYKINNRYDLVIFKPAAKNSLIGPRRIYSNNNVNTQNINAAALSGVDLSMLNIRTTFNHSASNSTSSDNGGTYNSNSNLNKITI
ncbi:unnamed protein product [Brachionus calyciflorus]|uniref:Uncharacterized protein n=1 Tax=Brachionus calyciflorus TaxID=104777 RepID=A0A813M6D7_9BILA|nr:unnamed protein product [Brachionus calyciflorus]